VLYGTNEIPRCRTFFHESIQFEKPGNAKIRRRGVLFKLLMAFEKTG